MNRLLRAVVGVGLLVAGLSACGDDDEVTESVAAIDLAAADIESVTFRAAGKSARYDQQDGSFVPGPGGTRELATVLSISDEYFPVFAYRILDPVADGIDPATPIFGLVSNPGSEADLAPECGAGCSMEVRGRDGVTRTLRVGGRTFNLGGFYAQVDGDERVFLLIQKTVGDIITMARGAQFAFPPPPKVAEAERKTEELNERGGRSDDPWDEYDAYLRQALAAELEAQAREAGRPGGLLVREATSTRDQPGLAGEVESGGDEPAPTEESE